MLYYKITDDLAPSVGLFKHQEVTRPPDVFAGNGSGLEYIHGQILRDFDWTDGVRIRPE